MNGRRIAPIDDLRATWQADRGISGALEAAFETIGFDETFAGRLVPVNGKRKFFKDSIWGMVAFDQTATDLIDSPLLQRLRGIRQLGFSNFVYPSAEHTRFIHTLGMAHVVTRFLESIEQNAGNMIADALPQVRGYKGLNALLPLTPREIVFAALLHDVGHMPFSHASETALVQQDGMFAFGGQPLTDVLATARRAFGKQISLSETLSILVVLSRRFATYYARLTADVPDDPDSLIRIACLIAGIPATPTCPNIQDIISAAAVDADKIDYVARDADACGISVGVDVSRIFMGSSLLEAKRTAYDKAYEGDDVGTVFVLNSSGADTLDEIVQARSALYQRVYLHPVTRTAEAILTRALHLNARLGTDRDDSLIDAIGVWALDDAALVAALRAHPVRDIAALARRLRLRVLPKKACALVPMVARDPAVGSSRLKMLVSGTFIEKLKRKGIADIGTLEIEDRIRREATALADLLRASRHAGLVPKNTLDLVMITPIAAMDASRPDALVFQNGELIRTPEMTNVQGQHDAQDIFKAVGFVFSDPDWRPLVQIAARKVILALSEETAPTAVRLTVVNGPSGQEVSARQRTILEFEGVTRRANIPRRTAERTMMAAADVGYFDERPELHIPIRPDEPAVIEAARTFRAFDGELGWAVDRTTLAAFVGQFPPRLRDPMLAMLTRGIMLDQTAMRAHLTTAIELRPGGGPAIACPLSASSGGRAIAMIKHAAIPDVAFASSLREALLSDDATTILLVDDNVASGVQASAQLHAYAGIAQRDRPARFADEDGLFEEGFVPDVLAAIKRRRIAVAVATGLKTGADLVADTAAALGYKAFLGMTFGVPIADGLDWPSELREHLIAIGRDLMAHRYAKTSYGELAEGPIKTKCGQRAFGYGGHGGLMTTTENVPSSTVTALWQPGIAAGRPWTPLFIRRGLLQHLVIG